MAAMQDFTRSNEVGGLAAAHAAALLRLFGLAGAPCVASDHPALAWRRAGLMAVTGRVDGPGLVAPVALTAAADGALAALRAIAPDARLPENGALLLGERARFLLLTRRGAVSANGSCRLLEVRDGRIALNLPREEDWELVPALLGEPAGDWAALARIAATRPQAALLEQGRLLGLAIAPDQALPSPSAPFSMAPLGEARCGGGVPLVVDLSALWAGPLAGALLGAAGARVIKVESSRRPDGARGGARNFYDLLNAGKASVALDFSDMGDLRVLRRLIGAADIVIESSRPRALAGLGVDAGAEVRRGASWLSITAHGRTGEAANWVGYGDDAGVAGGLTAMMRQGWGESLFAGDAIADPLTGITAAFAGWASWRAGGGRLISLALSEVVAHARGLYVAAGAELRQWQALAGADAAPLYTPRTAAKAAPCLGADTAEICAGLGLRPPS
jgi:crotonobetainyl-CoA:carnitine CoA-transferase CaiB-like acyl-CoA transferase